MEANGRRLFTSESVTEGIQIRYVIKYLMQFWMKFSPMIRMPGLHVKL